MLLILYLLQEQLLLMVEMEAKLVAFMVVEGQEGGLKRMRAHSQGSRRPGRGGSGLLGSLQKLGGEKAFVVGLRRRWPRPAKVARPGVRRRGDA